MDTLPNTLQLGGQADRYNGRMGPQSSIATNAPPMSNGMHFAAPPGGNPLRTAKGEDVPMTPETNPAIQQRHQQQFNNDAFRDWHARLSPDQQKAFLPGGMNTTSTLHGVVDAPSGVAG